MGKSLKKNRWSIALALLLSVAGMLSLCNAGCMAAKSVSVNYGTSKLYSVVEMEKAIEAVKEDFTKLEGCRLYSLSYAGDERCKQELEYANKGRSQDDLYTECIVFDSVFRSPHAGGGAWEANKKYYWSWILAKTANGGWMVINKGYA